jgi:hydrogenase expression/formation protein HypC
MSAKPVEIRTGASCDLLEDCITCGDIAVPMTVVAVSGVDARCRDADGQEETVAIELVGPVAPGDRLLVHARVAITRVEEEATP